MNYGKLLATLFGVIVLVWYGLLLLAPLYRNTAGSDFATFYYPAAQRFLAGLDPYTIRFYVQPPALLLVFAPFTLVPLETARLLWLLVEAGLLIGGLVAWMQAMDIPTTPAQWLLALGVFLSPNIMWGLMIGQSAVLMFAVEAGGLWLLKKNRPGWAGLVWGALVLKPHLLAVVFPALLAAPRRAWAAAGLGIAAWLLGPELFGIHLLVPFLIKLLPEVGEERFNKLNPADLFVNLAGTNSLVRLGGWVVLAGGALVYLVILWHIWRRRAENSNWQFSTVVGLGMVAAFLWLPYSLAYDMVLVAPLYLWRFAADNSRLTRPLVWNLAALWLLPIVTLALHAANIGTTLNPLVILGLIGLLVQLHSLSFRPGTPVTPLAQSEP